MLIDSFDSTKDEVEGVWVPIGHGAELKIAAMTNPEYLTYVRRVARKRAGRVRGQMMPSNGSEQAEMEQACRAISKHVLLGWRGIDSKPNVPLEYSEKTAYETLLAKPKFFYLVCDLAQDETIFAQAEQEEAAKN